jgi:fermentation-respiration switch protein FrsA (DUF1100 family)
MDPRLRTALMTPVAVALALYLAALIYISVAQRKFLYYPTGENVAPAAVGLPAFSVRHIHTTDGEDLLAWYAPPAPGRPLILYFHGNGGALGERNVRFQRLTATGDGVLAIAFRGYPGSTGTPDEEGLHTDAETAWREARSLGFEGRDIVAMGESLGSGVAVALASSHPVAALVLDSAFSSAVDVAASRFWMFPVRLLMQDQYRSDLLIKNVRAPLLMAHGTADSVVPIAFGEKLFALAGEPKKFIRVEGGQHLALGTVIPQVLPWIDAALARTP